MGCYNNKGGINANATCLLSLSSKSTYDHVIILSITQKHCYLKALKKLSFPPK